MGLTGSRWRERGGGVFLPSESFQTWTIESQCPSAHLDWLETDFVGLCVSVCNFQSFENICASSFVRSRLHMQLGILSGAPCVSSFCGLPIADGLASNLACNYLIAPTPGARLSKCEAKMQWSLARSVVGCAR